VGESGQARRPGIPDRDTPGVHRHQPTAPDMGLAERELHGRTAALPCLDSDDDAPEPAVPVLHPAAHHDDRAVGMSGHNQADRAQEQSGKISESSGTEYQREGVAPFADQGGRRVLMQHRTRQPHGRCALPGSLPGGGDQIGRPVARYGRVHEGERHPMPERRVRGPVHRLKARLGPVDADHQGNRHCSHLLLVPDFTPVRAPPYRGPHALRGDMG